MCVDFRRVPDRSAPAGPPPPNPPKPPPPPPPRGRGGGARLSTWTLKAAASAPSSFSSSATRLRACVKATRAALAPVYISLDSSASCARPAAGVLTRASDGGREEHHPAA